MIWTTFFSLNPKSSTFQCRKKVKKPMDQPYQKRSIGFFAIQLQLPYGFSVFNLPCLFCFWQTLPDFPIGEEVCIPDSISLVDFPSELFFFHKFLLRRRRDLFSKHRGFALLHHCQAVKMIRKPYRTEDLQGELKSLKDSKTNSATQIDRINPLSSYSPALRKQAVQK